MCGIKSKRPVSYLRAKITHMPNKTPPRWAAWSKTRQPSTRPTASNRIMAFKACHTSKCASFCNVFLP